MILDTTAIIDILKGNPAIDKKLDDIEEHNIPTFITSISIFEIWQGSADIENKRELHKIHELLESLGAFLFDIPSAQEAGAIHSFLKKREMVIEPEDSMIAGIAKHRQESLLTRNTKHFGRISGLDVQTY